jgi:small-conductance mechanosensitive channel
MPATSTSRPATGSYQAPVVHLHQPHDQQPPWLPLAIAGGLAVQLLLVALIAWKSLTLPVAVNDGRDDKVAAALEKLDKSLAALESRRQADLAEERAKARTEFLDAAFRELKGADDGAISRLQAQFDQTSKLSDDVAARDAEIREMRALIQDARGKIQSLEVSATREEKRLKSFIDDLEIENRRLQADVKKKKEELTGLNAKLNPKSSGDSAASESDDTARVSFWWWVTGGILAAVALGAGVWWVGSRSELAAAPASEGKKEPTQ